MAALDAQVDLRPDPAAPAAARSFAATVLRGWDIPRQSIEDVVLLVSEMVSNAVEHAGAATPLRLTLRRGVRRLRVSVSDGSPIRPVLRRVDRHSLRGRGMHLVDRLADRWGTEEEAPGKRVWLEIDVPPAGGPA